MPEPEQEPVTPSLGDRLSSLGRGLTSFLDRLAESKLLRLGLLVGVLAFLAVRSRWVFVGILGLVVSIFLHEMGHYLVAKRNGMKVTEFFIGFGPRIWSFRRGETEYGLKVIPAGAYVRIIGMNNLDEVAPEDESRSYRAQSFGKRMPVVLAGPAVNIGLGLLLLVVVFAGFGRPNVGGWVVGSVLSDSAAAAAGLQPDDQIVAVQGQNVSDFAQFRTLVKDQAGTTVQITVERNGEELTLPLTIGWVITGPAAGSLPGLADGDQVTAVNGVAVANYADLVDAVSAGGSLELAFTRDGKRFTATMDGPITLDPEAYRGLVGVTSHEVVVTKPASVLEAPGLAVSAFGDTVTNSVQAMGRLFSPAGIGRLAEQVVTARDDSSTVSGNVTPVTEPGQGQGSSSAAATTSSSSSSVDGDRPSSVIGIVRMISDLGSSIGWAAVLYIFAVVNIFLGLINLAPLPPLDGGHIVVACYEEVRSRISHTAYRVNMMKLMPVTYVVILLILGLGLSTMYLDIAKPVVLK
jgi:RIP metalloprotease RseP